MGNEILSDFLQETFELGREIHYNMHANMIVAISKYSIFFFFTYGTARFFKAQVLLLARVFDPHLYMP